MRLLLALMMSGVACLAADWNPKLAAEYLDQRQQAWSVWPTAAANGGGACFSCHTGMTYMLARPALRHLLGDKQPTKWETSILQKMAADAGKEPPGQLRMVETIFESLFLREDGRTISEARGRALDQLWSLQSSDGKTKGGWAWYNASLEPWEGPSSFYFGSSLAALAIGLTPAEYRSQPEVGQRIESLKEYLRNGIADRPLHNRLELLWASSALAGVITPELRKSIVDEVDQKQREDGAWTLAALGPWPEHAEGADLDQPSAYATAFTAYVLLQAGTKPEEAHLKTALEWLREHQDRRSGAWRASSMNKKYPAGSMQELFLQDGATGFAAAALAEAERR